MKQSQEVDSDTEVERVEDVDLLGMDEEEEKQADNE